MLKFRIDRSSRQSNTRIRLPEFNLAGDGHRVSDLYACNVRVAYLPHSAMPSISNRLIFSSPPSRSGIRRYRSQFVGGNFHVVHTSPVLKRGCIAGYSVIVLAD